MDPVNEYKRLLLRHQSQEKILKRRYNLVSLFRLIVAITGITFLYFYIQSNSTGLLIPCFLCLILFLFILKKHQKIEWERKVEKQLSNINEDEVAHVASGALPFENGSDFIDTKHPYAHDLDIFGARSLYQFLNRTETFRGRLALSRLLTSKSTKEQIALNQSAIKELTTRLEWRNRIRAFAQIKPDDASSVDALKKWVNMDKRGIPGFLSVLSYLTPFIVVSSFILYLITSSTIYWQVAGLFFIVNLLLLTTQMLRIKTELIPSMGIDHILRHYALILREIEHAGFESPYLVELQHRLLTGKSASQSIHQLSILFARMDHVQNIFASPLLNGIFLYHIHQLRNLTQWRNAHVEDVEKWLDTIGEFEALSSLANFSFNNPSYVFPTLNFEQQIEFKELGHPLIRSDKRITNHVSFNEKRFFILTGSNMSGKSTFLRTLGINMVLTNMGAAVCAKEANVHPLSILVSMRLADSLGDSESYFFAEVKRLKEIMDSLSNNTSFVLLDEILRGTNSDDKRSGTIAVVKKMVEKKAIGIIATHDLEVCHTMEEFPDILSNKRFEVEIIDNELSFDYKLRDGICENKSATFLMKKMEVID
ncbi:MAG: DNA mismatch repair protein [Bacteroidota bacterium]